MFNHIFNSGKKAVIAITGGGSEAIGELLRHGGGSNFLLDAVIPYSNAALNGFLGYTPEKYCSELTARQMAVAAFNKGLKLHGNTDEVIGISLNATLVKPNYAGETRADGTHRRHSLYIGVHTSKYTECWSYELEDLGLVREGEERVAALMLLYVLGITCHVPDNDLKSFMAGYAPNTSQGSGISRFDWREATSLELNLNRSPDPLQDSPQLLELANLMTGKRDFFIIGEQKGNVIYPGAFNPVTPNHVEIAKRGYEKTGSPINFEISILNVDKPPLDYIDIQERVADLMKFRGEPWFGSIILSRLPKFLDKTRLFDNSIFLIGGDTYHRLFNHTYYKGQTAWDSVLGALDYFKQQNAKFLVFQRLGSTVDPIVESPIFEIVPEQVYQDDGHSSTKARQKLS